LGEEIENTKKNVCWLGQSQHTNKRNEKNNLTSVEFYGAFSGHDGLCQ
jgi:hypothetical protein